MRMRVSLARFFMKLGTFIQSLPVVVMKADDLIEFSRQTYTGAQDVESWARDDWVDSGLTPEELELLSALPATTGELLLLAVGGGREAIPLARMGYEVTGVDYVPALVARAQENAARRGVNIQGQVQEISRLEVPAGVYDMVWLSRSMYSSIPTRKRRVEMVRRITRALKPGGFFLCQFHWDPGLHLSSRGRWVRRLAALAFGNPAHEEGDMLWGDIEFLHAFTTEEAVRSELEEGGLSVQCLQTGPTAIRGGAVSRKNPEPG